MNEKLQKIVSNREYIETPCGYVFIYCYDVDIDYSFYDVYNDKGKYLGEIDAQAVIDNVIDSCDESADGFLYDMDGLENLAESLS